MKKLFSLILVMTLVVSVLSAGFADGTDLPDMTAFNAQTLEGEPFTQDDLASRDLTVVNVWSVTCGPCIREMPALASFGKALPDNVQLIAICPDAGMDIDTVKDFLKKVGYEEKTLISGDGDLMDLLRAVMYTPTTFFLDSQGHQVGEVIIGSMPNLAEVYLEAINSALTQLGKPVIQLADAA